MKVGDQCHLRMSQLNCSAIFLFTFEVIILFQSCWAPSSSVSFSAKRKPNTLCLIVCLLCSGEEGRGGVGIVQEHSELWCLHLELQSLEAGLFSALTPEGNGDEASMWHQRSTSEQGLLRWQSHRWVMIRGGEGLWEEQLFFRLSRNCVPIRQVL